MDIVDFLSRHQITLDGILARIDAAVHLAPEDVLFVSGSLVEGLGNEKSDLDSFLITSRHDIEFTSLNDVTVIIGRCIVDVRVVQRAAIEDLLRRFRDWSELPREPRAALGFGEDDRKLLHRLRSGRAIHGAAEFERLQSCLGEAELARHRLDWARHYASTLQVDLVGLRADGDPFTLLFAAQDLLGHTIDALLAGYGYTNPSWKWRTRQLTWLPDTWEVELPGRPTGMCPVQRYLSLHRAPETVTLEAVFDHARRIVAFSRTVFPWAERRLLDPSAPLQLPKPQDTVPPSGGASFCLSLPSLDLDVAVHYKGGRFEVGRLNEGDVCLAMSSEAYLLLCLFDGETSRAYAAAVAEVLGGGAALLRDVTALVRYARLEAAPVVDERALAAILSQ